MGGVEQVIHQIATGAQKLGVQTDVLSLTPHQVDRTVPMNGYLVHKARMNFQLASTGFSASAFWRFAQLAQDADVVHYHFPWPFMDMVHFVTRSGKPSILTYHSDIVRQQYLLKIYLPLRWCFLNSVDHIVATSPNYLATSDVLAKYKHKTSVIPIGLDKAAYVQAPLNKLEYWRKQCGVKFFLFIGVIRYYKGLHILIEAAQETDYPIVIVGSGPIEQELKRQVSQLGLRNIHFFGHLSDEDKVALLQLSYCVVFPSHLRSEAFGISLLEGAMYGKPMISCEIGTGTTYINIVNETGLVVPPSDPIALRQAMRYLWEHPEIAAEMGRYAEKRYWDHFTADKMVQSYVDLYKDLVKHRRAC